MTSMGDVAAGMLAAAADPPAGDQQLMRLRLIIPMLVQTVPEGDALWTTVLRPSPRRSPVPITIMAGWLARWRGRNRRRDGWGATSIELHWTRAGIVACNQGRRIARFPLGPRLPTNRGSSS